MKAVDAWRCRGLDRRRRNGRALAAHLSLGCLTQGAVRTQCAIANRRQILHFRVPEKLLKRRDRSGTVVAWQWSRLGRISQAQDRSADWRAQARRSKTFIVRRKAPKGPNRSAPLVSATSVVAGAGFEPATFGL